MNRYIKLPGLILVLLSMISQPIFAQQDTTALTPAFSDTVRGIKILQAPEEIAIPFAVVTKAALNNAVSAVNAAQLPKLPLSNLSGLLAGRLSGLWVNWTGNQPGGGNLTYQIRGKSSYAGGATPIVLVDGIVRDFEDMDINEIESVSVLKDAGTLNWYGLSGGNGAIYVTTKHGKANQRLVTVDAQGGFQTTDNLIRPLNSYQYASLYNQALTNVGQAPAYDSAALYAYKNHTDLMLYPDNNYLDEFMSKSAPTQRYALSFSGGSNRIRYFTTLSYFNQQGLFKHTETDNFNSNYGYKRFNFRINLDYEVNESLTVTLLSGLRSEIRNDVGDGTTAVLNNIYNLPPNAFPIVNSDGTYGGTSLYQNNPMGQLQSTGYARTTTNVLLASVMAKQKLNFITKGLSANLLFSYDGYGNYGDGLTQNYAVINKTVSPAQSYRTPAAIAYRTAAFQTNTKNNEVWMGFDYDRNFSGDHKVTASVRVQQYVSAAVDRLDYKERMLAGRVDYGYKGRYMLGFTGSYNGSENYAPGHRFGFFPALTAGWLASDERFLKNSKVINYLKIRGSGGRSGNIGPTYDASGNVVRLPYRTLFTRGAGPLLGSSFSTSTTAYLVTPAGNPLTTWEKIDRINIGTDVSFLHNALSISADYFHETRHDILGTPNLPGILGMSIAQVNSGKVNSKGAEFSGTYNRQWGKFSIAVNGNITYAKNTVLVRTLSNGLEGQSQEGRYVNSGHYYIAEGIFQSQAEIDASPKQTLSGLVVPGDIKYKDVNNDNVIDAKDDIATDYTDIPKMFYGFGFAIRYAQFDLSTQFQGVEGRTINLNGVFHAGPNGLNQLLLDSWTPATAATAKYPRIGLTDNGNNTANSTYWLRSGDFLKMRTLEIGYSTPEGFNKRFRFKGARFFLGGYNLLTFSSLNKLGIDPETPNAGRFTSFPYVKTYSVGINVII
ncbi:TonB-linked outer membrane protein, SusC/RagA family [Chitinophaga jiangningensis]|uniref:TonB-linked outer membrane protein, SusC/RagA family n=1 Tax=Chitinophaga jiangningensis TaxID=1419482 RepID=A0A1M7C4D1_9BACT|nr:SusC/RagA family TonB-linked outer membrane protein [Chitinophaga jiangningensis]SHL62033.1 TonB-linked outer membrane protein, SusC/RagA family [Chitinophaga jiangningensis]